jgi:hypothetical protein
MALSWPRGAARRPTGSSLRRAPGGSSPLAFWLDQSLISFYELPHRRPYAHPAPRAASVRPDHGPHPGRTGPRFHRPAGSQSAPRRATWLEGETDIGITYSNIGKPDFTS